MKTFIILATGILLLVSCGENTLNKVSTLNIPDKYEQRGNVIQYYLLDFWIPTHGNKRNDFTSVRST